MQTEREAGSGSPDEATCRYGASRTDVRGPAVPLDAPYCAVLGGSEVYGKAIAEPFVARLGRRTGKRMVNLGVMNAGLDVFVRDEALLAVAAGAETVVIQTLGAHGLSNRFYTVHPRRNDRFLRQSDKLAALYPDIDFSEFAFVRHLLVSLRNRCSVRFEEVATELRLAWIARMRQLTSAIPGRRILLDIRIGLDRGLGPEPFLVTGDMIGLLRETVDEVISCDVTEAMDPVTTSGGGIASEARDGLPHFPPAAAHEALARALAPALGGRGGLAA